MTWASSAARAALFAGMTTVVLSAAPAWAQTNRALIVAVSEYPELDPTLWLTGPANDARLVRSYLLDNAPIEFFDSNIAVLADGVDDSKAPTGDNIRAALATLASETEPGDFVLLHFSGHGSQAPALQPGTEQDGLDELFLPADVAGWDQKTGTIRNALVDDELGAMINAIIDKGARVWAVFDSCHSGTVTRAGITAGDPLDAERSRKLSPLALGVPQEVLDAVEPVRTRSGNPQPEAATLETVDDGDGAFVYFYAAQTNETTPEMRLPADDPDRVSHGLFTFTLFETLAQNPALTYRQLGEEVLRRYSTGYRAQPTPLFEGSLDTPVFGSDIGEGGRIQQWPVKQDGAAKVFSAGRLHGISVGDELALLDSPAASDDAKLATIRVTKTDEFKSEFEIVDGGFVLLEPGYYARKPAEELRFSITAAMPDQDKLTDAEREAVTAVIDTLRETDREGLRLELVGPGERADIYLQAADGAVWLLPVGSEWIKDGANKTISVQFDGRDAGEAAGLLADTLARIARVTNLIRLGDSFGNGEGGLEVTYLVKSARTGEMTPIAPPAIPRVEPGDELFVEARNTSNRPLDLNILYVGVSYSIDFMYNGRIFPNETLRDGVLDFVEGEYGRERLINIVTQADPQSALADFGWLAQPAIGRTREAAAEEGGGFGDMLAEAGFGETTRAAQRKSREDKSSGIAQVVLETVAPGTLED
ncbi:caspase family protein [Oricola sp.]|uniref:caspase family protein n=1 Tax=Oricola sp. TaxID=1979950 RepID=UPI0025E02BF3|nr:caspase family protein [Oricola sp.]MCI5078569.1 caspase family protein [Oricola sp.]